MDFHQLVKGFQFCFPPCNSLTFYFMEDIKKYNLCFISVPLLLQAYITRNTFLRLLLIFCVSTCLLQNPGVLYSFASLQLACSNLFKNEVEFLLVTDRIYPRSASANILTALGWCDLDFWLVGNHFSAGLKKSYDFSDCFTFLLLFLLLLLL